MYSSALKPFVFNASDLAFLLRQINFRPLFDADGNAIVNWVGSGAIYDGHGNLIWDGISTQDLSGNVFYDGGDANGDGNINASDLAAAAVSHYGTSYASLTSLAGLRDVEGWNNNLNLDRSNWGRVDQPFLRTVASQYNLDSHGHTYFGGEEGYQTGTDLNGNALFNGGAFWANKEFGAAFGGLAGFSPAVGSSIGYSVTEDPNNPGSPVMNNVTDYTPRMISLLTTTGGVTFDLDTLGHIDYSNGVATVSNWGMLQSLGIQDAQERFDGSPGTTEVAPGVFENEYFVAAQNPGVSPTNGWFTLFGQFFDHGLDFIDKGAQGKSIKIAFAADDPLFGVAGSDGRPATAITVARASVSGFDANGNPEYINHTSPFIDQSQTYGSHAAVTDLLREWVIDPVDGQWKPGINMLNGTTLATQWTKPDGTLTNETLPTLNELRAHLAETGRADLGWSDVFNYADSGQALILDMNPRFDDVHLLKGDAVQDTALADAIAFLGDANNGAIRAGDSFSLSGGTLTLTLGSDLSAGPQTIPAGTYTGANALMLWVNFANFSVMSTSAIGTTTTGAVGDAVGTLLLASVGDHYIAGDGRVNENFGLTTVHHVFHEEHNFQVENLKNAIYREADARVGTMADGQYDQEYMKQFQQWDAPGVTWNAGTGNFEKNGVIAWDLDVMFNAAKLVVEMEYQHVAIDQYARTVTPDIKEFVGYTAGEDPTVSLEYAQAIFRFGHSQLRETIDTIDPDHGVTGKIMGYALKLAFLNPDEYANLGPAAIALGMTHQQGNEIDEFVTPALNQGLLGLPLDLAAINIARGRDVGIPALNEFRVAVGLRAYEGWADFGANMIHPDNLVNFIAAYSFDGDVTKAGAIIALYNGDYADNAAGLALAATLGLDQGAMTAEEFETFAVDYAMNFMNGGDKGVDAVDTWLGGLAEVHVTGGLLGETFNLVFVDQMERIQDGDRFYYLYRTVNQQFGDEIAGGQFKDIIERNTGLTHLGGSAFAYSDQYYDLGATADTANTVNNEHKYGAIVDAVGNTKGVFSDGGGSESRNGTTITVRITDPFTNVTTTRQFIRDTRAEDPNAPNGGLGIDGTPNSGAESTEVIVGTKYDDLIHARGGDDTVYGDAGNDIIYGENGIDRLYGGDGKDYLYGGDGPELTDGGAGDDFIWGDSSATAAAGTDQLIGGMGNDYISGGVGIDKLAGGGGDDVIFGDGDTDPFTHGGDGNDYIDGGISGDNLYGDNGDDVIVGAADQDILYGGNGDDILRPGEPSQALGGGPDEVLGGDGITDTGFDIIDFSDLRPSAVGIEFDLSNQANPQVQIDGTTPVPAATQIEGIVGSQNNDTLTGDNDVESGKDSWLIGGTGSDNLAGGLGDDVIIGGSMRLDDVVGHYQTAYDHNNTNDNANATGIVDVGLSHTGSYSQEQMDQLYQGASHRVAWDDVTSGGLIEAVNAQLSGVDYQKHFTEMLRSERFKDMMLGDGGDDATRTDTVTLAGNRADYLVAVVDYAGHNVVRLTGIGAQAGQGSDLVVDVENFQFADGAVDYATLAVRPNISANDVGIVEGDAGVATMTFRIALDFPVGTDVAVDWATASGTAMQGVDFIGASGTVTIPAGQTFVDVTIDVTGDTLFEGDEQFTIDLSNPTYAVVGPDASGAGTIVNDDAPPALTVDNVVVDEGGTATITLSIGAAAGKDIVVNYAAVDGSAVNPGDYALTSGQVTIPAGATTATLVVDAVQDTTFEGVESYTVNFTSTDTANNAVSTATIPVDPADAMPAVSISDPVAVTEGGAAVLVFTVSLDAASGIPVTLDYATADGEAIAGLDYTATIGSLTFNPGEVSKTVTVPVLDDAIYEAIAETMALTVSNVVGATVADGQAVGTINDDESMPTLNVSGTTVAEGNAGTTNLVFTVTLSAASAAPVTVNYATADGTATLANNDYQALSGPLTFNPGETSKTVTVLVTGDIQLEGDESVQLNLSNPVGAVLGTSMPGVISNDDIYNQVVGTAGPDVLSGTADPDRMTGLASADQLIASAGADYLDGGTGSDTADYSGSSGAVYANLGGEIANETALTTGTATTLTPAISIDTLKSIENVIGTAFGDRLVGSAVSNTFTPGAGSDVILGQGGIDTVSYADRTAGAIYANLQSPTVRETNLTAGTVTSTTAAISIDQVTSVSNVIGTGFGDVIIGSTANNVINGLSGADTINGYGGNDTIDGGDGNDVIYGGVGDDTIRQASTGGRDIVDGATNGTAGDTFELIGNAEAESFVIYTRAAAVAAGFGAGLKAATEIVITRQVGTGPATVITELDNIEEVRVLTSNDPIAALAGSNANNPAPGTSTSVVASGDTIKVVGDFTATSLRYNTITVEGSAASDRVDISGLTSAHRLVFNTNGGADAVLGTLRPQDVVNGTVAQTASALQAAGGAIDFADRTSADWLNGLTEVGRHRAGLTDLADDLAPLAHPGLARSAGLPDDTIHWAVPDHHPARLLDDGDGWSGFGNHHGNHHLL